MTINYNRESFTTSLVLTLLLLGAADGPRAMAQTPGTFTATGNMTVARSNHAAILLADGRVLIAGGGNSSTLASAELYDPGTGTFTATGNMTTARTAPLATLLPDGRVLITGGDAGGNYGTSAEIYDPSTGIFTATGSMTSSHYHATLLNDGKVLMTGGSIQTASSTAPSAELYDPTTAMFTPSGAYADTGVTYVLGATATLLPDGTVLMTNLIDLPTELAEVYDPVAGTFSLTGAMTGGDGTATLLTNGNVLLAGGEDSGDFRVDTAELYDASAGSFHATGEMTKPRASHTATLLPDGRVFIAGGGFAAEPPYGTDASTEVYDPSTGIFSFLGNMTARRSYHTATLLKDGRVLITGGVYWNAIPGPASGALLTAELYNPPVLVPAPALFSLSGDGRGQGAIWHALTGQIASADYPAVAGEILTMYTTSLAEGGAIPPQVAIGGRLAEILFFGDAPGYPGYYQVNFRVPSGLASGPAVPVRLTYLSRPSNQVTIGVQ
jgi:hypothetical protein